MDFLGANRWLTNQAIPLWLERGLDPVNGGFVESLSLDEGKPLSLERRCTVQARQIYVFKTAIELGMVDPARGREAVESGVDFLLRYYRLPSGAYRHSVTAAGAPADETPDLYAQAFALFGLAHAFAVLARADILEHAHALVQHLRGERAAPGGGFTEIENGQTVFRSNPHMHLFEAAIAWMEVDSDPRWHQLAGEILNLCLARFIDPDSGALAENFTAGWKRELVNGRFIFEPGHQYEWSWLMGEFQAISGRDLTDTRRKLFALAEKTGLDPDRRCAYDQVWSDYAPKKRSSRFWPQCERIKAASTLGEVGPAREAMDVLFRYFELPLQGLWYDIWEENGQFPPQPVKASSLYHIAGAITEAQALVRK